jgi:hypothetical protein
MGSWPITPGDQLAYGLFDELEESLPLHSGTFTQVEVQGLAGIGIVLGYGPVELVVSVAQIL